ncbi:MAG TPA: TetR/AcrR family transcriptional regulator [Mycobacteriales bacterium]|nr:TetR/AcrR family transcriptional regulator [Mycobacteriales bacterium]
MTQAVDRRDVILERAADLFARQGVAATTVREIADAVGILSGSLYHHFASKDEIVDAIVGSFMDDLVSRYDAVLASTDDAAERLRGLVAASLATVAGHPHATEIYQKDARYLAEGKAPVAENARLIRRAWIGVLEEGVETRLFRSDVPVSVIYPLLRDGLWLTARWFKPTRTYGYDELASDYLKVFLDGIRSR